MKEESLPEQPCANAPKMLTCLKCGKEWLTIPSLRMCPTCAKRNSKILDKAVSKQSFRNGGIRDE